MELREFNAWAAENLPTRATSHQMEHWMDNGTPFRVCIDGHRVITQVANERNAVRLSSAYPNLLAERRIHFEELEITSEDGMNGRWVLAFTPEEVSAQVLIDA